MLVLYLTPCEEILGPMVTVFVFAFSFIVSIVIFVFVVVVIVVGWLTGWLVCFDFLNLSVYKFAS